MRFKKDVLWARIKGAIALETQLRNGDPQNFDLFVMGVFSSDAIPIHLVTMEAFKLYVAHLKPDGKLIVNITLNYINYIDRLRMMFRVVDQLGMYAVKIQNAGYAENFYTSASWVILSRDKAYIEAYKKKVKILRARSGVKTGELSTTFSDVVDWRRAPHWTDDYSNLFSALKEL